MNKLFKSFISLSLLVIAMIMVVPSVFADIAADEKGKITISGVEDSVNVTAYRLMNVNFDRTKQQPTEPVYVWTDEVAAWVRTNYPTYIGADNRVTDTFKKGLDVAEFYDKLAAAIKSTDAATKLNVTASGSRTGNGDITDLEMGNSFVLIENGLKVYRPSAVNVVPKFDETTKTWSMDNPTIEVKSSTPQIEKTVEDVKVIGGKVGDVLHFEIKVDVPNYPMNSIKKTITILDNFDDGLTYNKDAQVYLDDSTTPLDSSKYTLTPAANGFTIEFDNDQYENVRGASTLYVRYTGTINGKALVTTGNKNEAKLIYNNNPYDTTTQEPTTDVTVYTYGLNIKKLAEDETTLLPGATFNILDEDGNTLLFVKDSDGKYHLAENGEAGATADVVVGSDGNVKGILELTGLATGTYTIKETVAPEGYVKLQGTVDVTIVDANLDGKDDNGSTGYVIKGIVNNKGFELPVTGGIGTLIFSVLGILFMGVAAFLIKSIIGNKKVENN